MIPMSLPHLVLDLIADAVREAAADPAVPLAPRDTPDIERDLAAHVEGDPRLQEVADAVAHATNGEPWYRSRVTWGALVAGGASVAGAFGLTLGQEDREVLAGGLAAAGGLVGAALTLYGRWKARRPLGTAH